ncbi:MAG: type I methionyl aminopeptidase, partial [Patescibacteria group bacterium]
MIKKSGNILSAVLNLVAQAVRPGVSTLFLDQLAEKEIRAHAGAKPAFLGHRDRGGKPYPASLCTSVNEDLVHCIPKENQTLLEGDIVGLDLGVNFQGYFSDMAVTVGVGGISREAKKLIQVTEESLEKTLKILRPGLAMGDVGYSIQARAEKAGFSVIRDLVGHGVGLHVHEDPQVPNYGVPGQGIALQA